MKRLGIGRLLGKNRTEKNSKIVNLSIPERNGAYVLYIERGDNMAQNPKVDYVFQGKKDDLGAEKKEGAPADKIVIECQQQEVPSVPERITTYARLLK